MHSGSNELGSEDEGDSGIDSEEEEEEDEENDEEEEEEGRSGEGSAEGQAPAGKEEAAAASITARLASNAEADTSNALPFVIPAPRTYTDFAALVAGRSAEQLAVAIQRIRVCNVAELATDG